MKEKHKTVHPWHGLSPGENSPNIVTAFIEVPKESMLKYELDKESGFIKLDRVLYSAVHYPGDYGFIPRTLSEDGDPLDIIIISNHSVFPGVIARARPLGVLEMIDDNERDEKIIAAYADDPRFDNKKNIEDINEHVILEIKHFFETYKELQKKEVKILSIKGVDEAKKEIQLAIKKYSEEYEN